MTNEPIESIDITITVKSIANGYLVSGMIGPSRLDPLPQNNRNPTYCPDIAETKGAVRAIISNAHIEARRHRQRQEAMQAKWEEAHPLPQEWRTPSPPSQGEEDPFNVALPAEKKGDEYDDGA
jgi:hypothetical protein